jgi:hypothetical protein
MCCSICGQWIRLAQQQMRQQTSTPMLGSFALVER